MPFTMPNYPILTPEQSSPYANLMQNALQAYLGGIKASYARPMSEQALQEAILKNSGLQQQQAWNPKIWQSEIGLRGAQSGLFGEQAKWYGKKSQSEINLQNQQSAQIAQDLQKQSMINNLLRSRLQGSNPNKQQPSIQMNSTSSQMNVPAQEGIPNQEQTTQTNLPTQNAQQPSVSGSQEPEYGQVSYDSSYGIQNPSMSDEDIVNKLAFGTDSFKQKLDIAKQLQLKQNNDYLARTIQYNKESQDANDFDQELSRYNYHMGQATLKGAVGGHFPAMGSESQTINTIISNMSLGAIERVRDAMGSARFAVADLNVALGTKPSRSWNEGTRDFYTDFYNSVNDRMKQRAKFYTIASQPENNIPIQLADAAWTAYQNSHPIVKNEKTYKLNKYKTNDWMDYLTPQALNQIRKTGEYNPDKKEKNTNNNVVIVTRNKRGDLVEESP